MRQLSISRKGTENLLWAELGIRFEKLVADPDKVMLILPVDMWLATDEYQMYKYKIICHSGIILGYVYDDNILANDHGRDIYLTAKVNGKLYQSYITTSI